MKCSSCQEEKELGDFNFKYKAKGIRHKHCKSCQKFKHAKHYQDNKEKYKAKSKKTNKEYILRNRRFVAKYKSDRGCLLCSELEPCALDFHHIKGKDKNVSKLVNNSVSLKVIKEEINKCIVLCANCHRKVHAGLLKIK